MDCLSDELGDILNNLGGITGRNFGKSVAVRIQPTSFTQRYTRILRGKQDNKSVLDLPTPLELYKMGHTAEEYDELVSFYSSDAWKEIEREHLNSDRWYYEKRKALIDPEEKEVATKKKYYDPEPFQLRAEEKFTNGFDDLFDDPVLQSCYREITEASAKNL